MLLQVIWDRRPYPISRSRIRNEDQLYKIVLTHLLGRAIRTYRAILSLCRAGHPIEALMLCRSLFEDVVAAHWAALPENQPSVIDKVVRQERFDDETRSIVSADFHNQPYERELPQGEYAALKREFRGGHYSWFGNMRQAKEMVKQSFAYRGYSARDFDFYDRIVSREASMNIHNTVRSFMQSAKGSASAGDDHFPSYGLSSEAAEDDMRIALLTAPACLGTIAQVVFEEFEIDTQEVARASQAAQHAALRLIPSKRRALGRNDPCWCGSGVKLKNCHGL